jgi:hypothetical protein
MRAMISGCDGRMTEINQAQFTVQFIRKTVFLKKKSLEFVILLLARLSET